MSTTRVLQSQVQSPLGVDPLLQIFYSSLYKIYDSIANFITGKLENSSECDQYQDHVDGFLDMLHYT